LNKIKQHYSYKNIIIYNNYYKNNVKQKLFFFTYFKKMGFKENLKAELTYSNMLVKELAALSGVKKHTIDNYLNTHNAIPSASAAVSIARALGVSVEYLVTGYETKKNTISALAPDLRLLLHAAGQLNKNNRKIALALLKTLKELEKT
jgi:transcriptional regulator with XRE-family HTH domain